MKKSYLLTSVFVWVISFTGFSQIVPFYPIEIFFNPCGYTNQLPGCKPELYTTFSSLKVVLNKDLPSPERWSNTIAFVGNLELYHDITKSRDYTPFSLNPVLRTHFFANDIFTPSLELNGNFEFLPGTDQNGNTFNIKNYRFRIRPFVYFIISPNLLFQQMATYGISKNSDRTRMKFGKDSFHMVWRDYYLLKYEATFIYFTKFHTRIFLAPFCFYNRFEDIPARSRDGTPNYLNPKLRENGFGCALGFRYQTFTWGFTEAVFEYEKNNDLIYDANSYTKLKFNTKWENQYFTERFGYLVMFDFIRHISKNFATGFPDETNLTGGLGQTEIRGDVMAIINLNRNVSVRPEFDLIYKKMPGGGKFQKYRYWLHLHIMF